MFVGLRVSVVALDLISVRKLQTHAVNNPNLPMATKYTITVRREIMKKSISYKGPILWNNLNNETREIES